MMSIRDTCFSRWAEGYTPPTPAEIRELLRSQGLSGSVAATLIGVTPRAIRYWLADPDQPGHRRIPYAAWRLLILELEPFRAANTGDVEGFDTSSFDA